MQSRTKAPAQVPAKSVSKRGSKGKENRKRGPTPDLITSQEWSNKNRSVEDRTMKRLKGKDGLDHNDARATVKAMVNDGTVQHTAWKELLQAKIDAATKDEDDEALQELLAVRDNGFENKNN